MFRNASVFAAASLLAATQVYASTYVMTIDPAADMAGAVDELRAAIDSANSGGGTVELFPDATYEFPDYTPGLNALPEVSAQVTIQGQGATLRLATGAPSMRFLAVSPAGSLTVHDLTLAGASGATAGAWGGAIYNAGQMFMYNSTVRDSEANTSAVIRGAAVYNSGSFTASGCSFLNTEAITSNVTNRGGAIQSVGPLFDLQDCVVANNRLNTSSSGAAGGGIYVTAGSVPTVVLLTRCEVRDNEITGATTLAGGGIAIESGTGGPLTVTLDSCTVSGNRVSGSTTTEGGGLFVGAYDSLPFVVSITNSTISGNASQGISWGGGMTAYLPSATAFVHVDHCTIAYNTAGTAGGGICRNFTGGTLTVENSIVAGNSATSEPEIRGWTQSLNYSLIGNGSTVLIPLGATGNIMNVDAKLGPLANNGGGRLTHMVLAGSPAIDAADPASTATADQRGQSRPFDSGYGLRSDIGAVEVQLARLDAVSLSDPDGTGNTDTAVYTNQNPVTLTLSGVAGATPTALRYSNEADLSTYTEDTFDSGGPYSVTLSPAGDGPKNLYVALPAADGLSQIRSASITLDTVAPTTGASVASGVIAQPSSTFDVDFTSSDATSGLQGVRLFYRHNGGAWTQYGTGLFTSSPINFDTASAEGNGTYEFYTAGVDNAGNAEDKSAQTVEATVVYTNNTRVMDWKLVAE